MTWLWFLPMYSIEGLRGRVPIAGGGEAESGGASDGAYVRDREPPALGAAGRHF